MQLLTVLSMYIVVHKCMFICAHSDYLCSALIEPIFAHMWELCETQVHAAICNDVV